MKRNKLIAVMIALGVLALSFEAKAEHTSNGHVIAGAVITISCIELTDLPRPVCFLIPLGIGLINEQLQNDNNVEDIAEWAAGGFAGGTIVTIWRWEF